jgi:hypothetical protein
MILRLAGANFPGADHPPKGNGVEERREAGMTGHPSEIAIVTRGGIRESSHYGVVVAVDAAGELIGAAGDPDDVIFFRSSAKPDGQGCRRPCLLPLPAARVTV